MQQPRDNCITGKPQSCAINCPSQIGILPACVGFRSVNTAFICLWFIWQKVQEIAVRALGSCYQPWLCLLSCSISLMASAFALYVVITAE